MGLRRRADTPSVPVTRHPVPVVTGDLQASGDALAGHPGNRPRVLIDGDRRGRGNRSAGELGAAAVKAELLGAGDLATSHVEGAGDAAAQLVAGAGHARAALAGLLGDLRR